MKKIICLVLSAALLMGGCVNKEKNISEEKNVSNEASSVVSKEEKEIDNETVKEEEVEVNDRAHVDENGYRTCFSEEGKLQVVSRPKPNSFKRGYGRVFKYDKESTRMWQIDLREYDLSHLDLKDRYDDLIYAEFDTGTKWPESLPEGFDPEKILEYGMNPGLGLRELHKKGITGKGVGVAVIDQGLLVDHKEYGDRLKLYEEVHKYCADRADFHGSSTASLAVGKNTGVAPEADLYYIACDTGEYHNGKNQRDLKWLGDSIERIIEANKILPKENKIRVISISLGFYGEGEQYEKIADTIERAEKDGIHVINIIRLPFWGLGRNPLEDPDDVSSYSEAIAWSKQPEIGRGEGMLLVPMDSRTTAASFGKEDYSFYREGGMSWSAPYVAGLYALACQVNPDITPDQFWKIAMETGDRGSFYDENVENPGKIVNPKRLLEEVGKMKKEEN